MVASTGYAEFLREQFAPLGALTLRRMFGKTGVFLGGLMFAMVADDVLYFRVDEAAAAAFEEARANPPLSYAKGDQVIDLAFWRAPDRLMDESDELIVWARLALEAASRVASGRQVRGGKARPS